jgi:tryptophanase
MISRIDENFYKYLMKEKERQKKSVRQITEEMASYSEYINAILQNKNNVRSQIEKMFK